VGRTGQPGKDNIQHGKGGGPWENTTRVTVAWTLYDAWDSAANSDISCDHLLTCSFDGGPGDTACYLSLLQLV